MSLSGQSVAILELPQASSVLVVKQHLLGITKVPVCCQQLIYKTSALSNDAVLLDLPSPLELVLVMLTVDPSQGKRLLEAANKGNASEAHFAICERADVEHVDKDGKTPLLLAAKRGHGEVVQLLCVAGSDVDRATHLGRAPLHIAALSGYGEVARVLCLGGACVNLVVGTGHTPAYVAAQQGHLDVLRCLFEAQADFERVGRSGNAPLHIAARQGHLESVRFLYESGADINKAMQNGNTALHISARQGLPYIARFLCEAGAAINSVIDDAVTPLHVACREGHLEIVRLLCEAGASQDTLDDCGRVAARIAAQNGHIVVVRYLCGELADADMAAGRYGKNGTDRKRAGGIRQNRCGVEQPFVQETPPLGGDAATGAAAAVPAPKLQPRRPSSAGVRWQRRASSLSSRPGSGRVASAFRVAPPTPRAAPSSHPGATGSSERGGDAQKQRQPSVQQGIRRHGPPFSVVANSVQLRPVSAACCRPATAVGLGGDGGCGAYVEALGVPKEDLA
eukprot:CAMPEP_0115567852 /NCGR_PEP_ID=MMETSP0271-20121206/104336_1 /TAXON_ID=71861 /ORGANISM="Scrippsiella trochoidea, Strain CCMP3099" /LENGTH=508 /DNA_ID=CAMNT_0003002249 /DNA_START=1 /DNA_END=1523 /DNA_ORIENTATION=-